MIVTYRHGSGIARFEVLVFHVLPEVKRAGLLGYVEGVLAGGDIAHRLTESRTSLEIYEKGNPRRTEERIARITLF
jgi:hypothetical protein